MSGRRRRRCSCPASLLLLLGLILTKTHGWVKQKPLPRGASRVIVGDNVLSSTVQMASLSSASHEKVTFVGRKLFVFNFPPVPHVYSVCPFSMKLESFLRINKISFETIYGGTLGSKGMVPFVKLDDAETGTEIPDSNVVLRRLLADLETHSESGLSQEQRAVTHMIIRMLEEHTQQIGFYYRYALHMVEFLDELEIAARFPPGSSAFWLKIQPASTQNKTNARGLSRHSDSELWSFSNDDLQAISDYLGDKPFIFGDKPSLADCAVFGHLSQFLWIPIDFPQKAFLKKNCPNVMAFMSRFRDQIWPDWDSLCSITIDYDGGAKVASNKFEP